MVLALAVIAMPLSARGAELDRHAQGYAPPPAKDGYSYPDCFCTDSNGERIELGQSVCLEIGRRKIWALCDMSLNNPTWRHSDEGCPSV